MCSCDWWNFLRYEIISRDEHGGDGEEDDSSSSDSDNEEDEEEQKKNESAEAVDENVDEDTKNRLVIMVIPDLTYHYCLEF